VPGGKNQYLTLLKKKCQCFPIAEYFFADWKMEPDWKYIIHPAGTSLKKDLSYISWPLLSPVTHSLFDNPFKVDQYFYLTPIRVPVHPPISAISDIQSYENSACK
jgi:hypothetical protein